jgi:hypothetical protein
MLVAATQRKQSASKGTMSYTCRCLFTAFRTQSLNGGVVRLYEKGESGMQKVGTTGGSTRIRSRRAWHPGSTSLSVTISMYDKHI